MPFGLTLDPADRIQFKGPLNTSLVCELRILNPTGKRQAWKVKCTNNDLLRIRPSIGVLNSGEEATVTLSMMPVKQPPTRSEHFVVQHMQAVGDATNPQTVWKRATKHEPTKRLAAEFSIRDPSEKEKIERRKSEVEKKSATPNGFSGVEDQKDRQYQVNAQDVEEQKNKADLDKENGLTPGKRGWMKLQDFLNRGNKYDVWKENVSQQHQLHVLGGFKKVIPSTGNLENASVELCVQLLMQPTVQNYIGIQKRLENANDDWIDVNTTCLTFEQKINAISCFRVFLTKMA